MNARRDDNRIPVLLGTLDSDGQTIVPVEANPANHRLAVMNGDTGSDLGTPNAKRDENRVPALMAVSSADGVTPVAVYADSDGHLLIDNS
jgi:hypothetical protein